MLNQGHFSQGIYHVMLLSKQKTGIKLVLLLLTAIVVIHFWLYSMIRLYNPILYHLLFYIITISIVGFIQRLFAGKKLSGFYMIVVGAVIGLICSIVSSFILDAVFVQDFMSKMLLAFANGFGSAIFNFLIYYLLLFGWLEGVLIYLIGHEFFQQGQHFGSE